MAELVGDAYIRITADTTVMKRALTREMKEAGKDDAGALSIATTHTQARYVLPPVLKKFRDKYPKVRLHLHQGNSEQIADLAASDRIDFAIATGSSPIFSGIVRLPCYRWHRAIVVPEGSMKNCAST